MPPSPAYMYFCGNGDTLGKDASEAMAKLVWRGLAQDFSPSTVVGLRRNAVLAASFVFGLALAISLAVPVDNVAPGAASGGDQAGSAGGAGAVDGAPNGAGAGAAGAIPLAGSQPGAGAQGAPRAPGQGAQSSNPNPPPDGGPGPEGNNSNNSTEPQAGVLPDTECLANPDMCGFDSMGNPIDLVTGVTSGAPSPGVSGTAPTGSVPMPTTTVPPIG